MLNKLTLKYFRRHESLTVDFTDGINCIRAANEGGKTTLTEAIGYALFGTKALRTSLDDTVTWGIDVKSLKVELTVTLSDTFTFKRSKGGAEVLRGDEVFITGQNEVSAFAATLLGADSAIANKLMFASQNGIRGALEEGPKALSTMIEDLAGFSTFDTILDAAQEKLALGSPNLLEERLIGAQNTLAAIKDNLPPQPDLNAFQAKIAAINDQIASDEKQLPSMEATVEELERKYEILRDKYLAHGDLVAQRDSIEQRIVEANWQIKEHGAAANVTIDESQIDALKARIADADNYAATFKAYKAFRSVPTGSQYLGDEEAFNTQYVKTQRQLQELQDEIKELNFAAKQARASRIDHDKCDKCGQDITHLGSVRAQNEKAEATLSEIAAKIEKLEVDEASLRAQLNVLDAIDTHARQFRTAIKGIESYINIEAGMYPPTISWKGNTPGNQVPVAPRSELAELEAAIKARNLATAKLEVATDLRNKAVTELESLTTKIAAQEWPSSDDMELSMSQRDSAVTDHQAAQGRILLAQREIAELGREHNAAAALWEAAQLRMGDAQNVIDACKKDLNSLAFNNALVKKLRSIRPIIANKLWTTVLATVSVMFSQMRGINSVVTKEKDGFKVGGQSIESLSGSTLDVLGLALRVSLIKTFLPNCRLLVADEPAHGCDDARTAALLGFLQNSSMEQVLLITHEEISTSIASNIINLEG